MIKNYLRLQLHEQLFTSLYPYELYQVGITNAHPDYDEEQVAELVEKHKTKHAPEIDPKKKLEFDKTPYKEKLLQEALEKTREQFEKSFKPPKATPSEIVPLIFEQLGIDTTPFKPENKKASFVTIEGDPRVPKLAQFLGLTLYEVRTDTNGAIFARSNQALELQQRRTANPEGWEKAELLASAIFTGGTLSDVRHDITGEYNAIFERLAKK